MFGVARGVINQKTEFVISKLNILNHTINRLPKIGKVFSITLLALTLGVLFSSSISQVKAEPLVGELSFDSTAINVTEGANNTYSIVLLSQPVSDVVVTLSHDGEISVDKDSVTFTDSNWETPQIITVTGTTDNKVEGSHDSTITHSIATDTEVAEVVVTIADATEAGYTIPTSNFELAENNQSVTREVVLTAQPINDVVFSLTSTNPDRVIVTPATLTFTNANWSIQQEISIASVDDYIQQTSPVTADISIGIDDDNSDPLWADLTDSSFTVTLTDNDTAGVTVSPTSVSTTEGGDTDEYTVKLDSQPTGNVVINVIPDDQSSTDKSTLTFTAGNWNSDQTVTVTAVDDTLIEGNHASTITHEINTASTDDALYDSLDSLTIVTNNISDNDNPGFSLSTENLSVEENGGTNTFSVVLSAQPQGTVNFALVSSNTDEATVSPTSITFTNANWDEAQVVTVTGVDDDHLGNDSAQISVSVDSSGSDANWDSLPTESVDILLLNNDEAGVTVSPTSVSTTEGGDTDEYTLVLTAQPSSEVIIDISPDGQSLVDPNQVTFTTGNWNLAQTITVSANDDTLLEPTHSSTISHSLSGDTDFSEVSISSVTNTITDNDQGAIEVESTSLVVGENGGEGSIAVRLTQPPTASVVVQAVSADTSEATVSPSELTFTTDGWQDYQNFLVVGVDDNIDRNDSTTITLNIDEARSPEEWQGTDSVQVEISLTDNDTAGVTVSPTSVSTTEGGDTDEYTVKLDSQPTGNVVINVIPDDQSSTDKSTLTFTAGNWNSDQTVTVTAVDDVTVEGTHSSTINHEINTSDTEDSVYLELGSLSQVANNITDNDSPAYTLSDESTSITEGSSQVISINLQTRPTSTDSPIKLEINSSDTNEASVDPSFVEFTYDNWNTPKNFTIYSIEDYVVRSDTATISISPAETNPTSWKGDQLADKQINVSFIDNDVPAFSVSQLDVGIAEGDSDTVEVMLDVAPENQVALTVASSNPSLATVSPNSLIFTNANWDTPQVVTLEAVENDVVGNSTSEISLSIDTSNSDAAWHGLMVETVSLMIQDNDSPQVLLSPTDIELEEGSSGAVSLRLGSQPQTDSVVVIELIPNTTELDLGNGFASNMTVSFDSTNWNVNQQVPIMVQDNSLVDDNRMAEIRANISVIETTDPDYLDLVWDEIIYVQILNNDDPEIPVPEEPTPPKKSSKKPKSESENRSKACTNSSPTGKPYLFQIKMQGSSAELFFAPTQNTTDYLVMYNVVNNDQQHSMKFAHKDNSGVVSTTINDLATNTQYSFSVRSFNECQPGEWSNEMVVKTSASTTATLFYAGGESEAAGGSSANTDLVGSELSTVDNNESVLLEASPDDFVADKANNDPTSNDRDDGENADNSHQLSGATNSVGNNEQPNKSWLRRVWDTFTNIFSR